MGFGGGGDDSFFQTMGKSRMASKNVRGGMGSNPTGRSGGFVPPQSHMSPPTTSPTAPRTTPGRPGPFLPPNQGAADMRGVNFNMNGLDPGGMMFFGLGAGAEEAFGIDFGGKRPMLPGMF